MARLPNPGGDDGTWGDILNAYLEVSLNNDGTLKSISASSLDGSVQASLGKADSAVQSVNGKTGSSVTLAASDVSAVSTSQLGAPSGVATLDSGSHLNTGQLPSSVVTSGATSTAKAQIPIASASSSNAIVWQAKTIFDVRDYGVVGDGTTDDTAAFQAALNASNAANGELFITPGLTVKLAGTVLLADPTVPELRISGGGRGSVILDANTTGPCLRYANSSYTAGRVKIKSLVFRLGVQKAAFNMVELVKLATSDFMFMDVDFEGDASVNFYKCNAALYMQDMWEGEFISCRWHNLIGHPIYYTCPGKNGGNVKWDSCQFIANNSACYFDGQQTTNNLLFDNTKWVSVGDGYEFYYQITSGIPAAGATTIQLPTGVDSHYFVRGGAVVLYSAAGLEVVHCSTASTPYNSSTGVLTLRDSVVKSHNCFSDLRVVSCDYWSVITGFLVPNMLFSSCHFEQCPAFLWDAPGARFDCCEISISQTAYTGQARGVYLAGRAAEGYKFDNCKLDHPNGVGNTGYAMAFGVAPAPSGTSGTPGVEINGVTTYTAGQASMADPLYTPLSGDTTYLNFAKQRVMTSLTQGLERMSVPGYNAWNTSRSVTNTYTLVYADDIILADATGGAFSVNLNQTVNKTVRIKKVDSSGSAVTIVAGGSATIDGAASIQLTSQYQNVVLTFDGTNFWKV